MCLYTACQLTVIFSFIAILIHAVFHVLPWKPIKFQISCFASGVVSANKDNAEFFVSDILNSKRIHIPVTWMMASGLNHPRERNEEILCKLSNPKASKKDFRKDREEIKT